MKKGYLKSQEKGEKNRNKIREIKDKYLGRAVKREEGRSGTREQKRKRRWILREEEGKFEEVWRGGKEDQE